MKPSREKIETIAAAQKLLLWAILAGILLIVGILGIRTSLASNPVDPATVGAIRIAIGGLQITLAIFQIVAVVKLCLALEEGWATVLYAVLQCVPCVNLIMLLFLNGRATNRLKAAGIRVGLMGAHAGDLAKYQPAERQCPGCGEAVEGAVETCPICGADLPSAQDD